MSNSNIFANLEVSDDEQEVKKTVQKKAAAPKAAAAPKDAKAAPKAAAPKTGAKDQKKTAKGKYYFLSYGWYQIFAINVNVYDFYYNLKLLY